jgi:phage shock protein A
MRYGVSGDNMLAMSNPIVKWWKYLVAKLNGTFNEKADPKVQLEQALEEAQNQDRRLREQAANVIAGQKQAEMQLNRSMDELQKVNANTRQAVLMAADAEKSGDTKRAGELNTAASSLANKMIMLEKQVEDQKAMVLQSTSASDAAKAAVQQNSAQLQKKMAERGRLMSQLEQAKMQEQMNSAMASMNATIGQDVPTLEEVRGKIEQRYAKAKATTELNSTSVESHMMEIESATADVEAQARLSQLKAELGLTPAAAPAVEIPKPTESA